MTIDTGCVQNSNLANASYFLLIKCGHSPGSSERPFASMIWHPTHSLCQKRYFWRLTRVQLPHYYAGFDSPQGMSMMPSARRLAITLVIPFVLVACSGHRTSVENNARHMAYQLKQIHFDANTQPLTADNTRLMVQFLNQFYASGKEDRAAGLTTIQAQQRVDSFTKGNGPFSAEKQKTIIINRTYDADQPDKRIDIMKTGAIQSYWDGYNGRS